MFLRRVNGGKRRDVQASDKALISALIYKHAFTTFHVRTEVPAGAKYNPSESSCAAAADAILTLVYGLKSSDGPDLEERVSRLEKWAKGEIGGMP